MRQRKGETIGGSQLPSATTNTPPSKNDPISLKNDNLIKLAIASNQLHTNWKSMMLNLSSLLVVYSIGVAIMRGTHLEVLLFQCISALFYAATAHWLYYYPSNVPVSAPTSGSEDTPTQPALIWTLFPVGMKSFRASLATMFIQVIVYINLQTRKYDAQYAHDDRFKKQTDYLVQNCLPVTCLFFCLVSLSLWLMNSNQARAESNIKEVNELSQKLH